MDHEQQAEQFEQRRRLAPHQLRVLDEKIAALKRFTESASWTRLGVNEVHRMQRQFNHMVDYSIVLGERIAAFGGERQGGHETVVKAPSPIPHAWPVSNEQIVKNFLE